MEPELADVVLSVCGVLAQECANQIISNRKKKRKIWVRDWVARRNILGGSNTLTELRVEDRPGFMNYMRMSDDFGDILSEIPDPSNKEIQNMFPKKSPFKFKSALPIGFVDYRDLSLPNVCGYLMKKCLEKHSYNVCINYATFQQNLDQPFLFSHFKAFTNKENSTYDSIL
ncbi:hypothetical protein QTP88_008057 [Uroleucon formosanum]